MEMEQKYMDIFTDHGKVDVTRESFMKFYGEWSDEFYGIAPPSDRDAPALVTVLRIRIIWPCRLIVYKWWKIILFKYLSGPLTNFQR